MERNDNDDLRDNVPENLYLRIYFILTNQWSVFYKEENNNH